MRSIKIALSVIILSAGFIAGDAHAISRQEARQQARGVCLSRLGDSPGKQALKTCVQRQTKRILRRESAAEICYAVYKPICGINNVSGEVKTYSNDCVMKRNNAEKIHDGVCDASDK